MKLNPVNLDNYNNEWIFGSPPAIVQGSYFISKNLQIKFINSPFSDSTGLNDCHYHTGDIEEYYLVLKGFVKIEVNDNIITLKKKDMLKIPPLIKHKLVQYSNNIELLVIRAPPSSEEKKVKIT